MSIPNTSIHHPSSIHQELQYLNGIRDIIDNGHKRTGRNGVVISKPGMSMRWSLADNTIPLLTSKRVYWKGVKEELLWMLSGSTYAPDLAEKGVHIWDANASRDFLDSRGLTNNVVGDLGPIYGYQWRHWSYPYKGVFCKKEEDGCEYNFDKRIDYTGKGIDQIQNVIDNLRMDPYTRRNVVSAWNVADLDSMALPPCHMFMQFYLCEKGLTCMMYQRSADWGLGVPFNIASYSLLTHMIASVVGVNAYEFVHFIGDAHIYEDHEKALKSQLERPLHPFPKVRIEKKESIDDILSHDIVLEDYKHSGVLNMKMSA